MVNHFRVCTSRTIESGRARAFCAAEKYGFRVKHVFRVGKNRYGDPFAGLAEAKDEEETRLGELAASGAAKISYTYDLGACWQHEITLEATLAREAGGNYPVCAGFSGDSPEEYPPPDDPSNDSDDEPAQPRWFGLPDVNRKLAALGPRES